MEASPLRPRVAEWAKNPYMIAYIVVSSVMIALLLIHVVLSCTICRVWRQKRKDAHVDPEQQQGPIDPRPYECAVPAPGCLDPGSFAESPTNSRSGDTFEEIDLSDGVKTAHAVPVMHVQKEPQADDTPRSILREDRPQGPPFFTLRTVQLSPRSKGVTFAPTPQVFAPA
ncbi:hypothetical protein GGS24DRAFT_499072 [Hypoxylon argillaceum]|nr:hypothetical protein GGS24DRAFT_499072 [Hypoxylon argillaceum]KAI1149697.1 hypothetical protein F4825DRAFT_453231 [Nemania diffusa]